MNLKSLILCLLPVLPAQAYDGPTMGWSSWNTYRVNISDALIRHQADALKAKGLQAAGYNYVNIDDGFFGGRAADGRLLIHPERFPQGLKPVVDYVHALGFKAGIYSDAGRNTCGHFWDNDTSGRGVGLYGHDQADADFFFKELGFDFIKIDFCGGDAKQNHEQLDLDERERYTAIRRAIDATGRKDVRVNVCRWAFPGTWVHSIGSSWRISGDIAANWGSVKRIIAENRYLSAYAGEGSFNDMDMLEIGRGLTAAQERTHFGMWCVMSSPLLIGCDVTTIPEASLALLKNPELIAVNQDALGLQARPVKTENGVTLFVKDVEKLGGRSRVVALYNPGNEARRFTLRFADVELGGRVALRDLFARAPFAGTGDGAAVEVEVAANDTRIFKLTGTRRLERTTYEAECGWLERYQELGLNPALGYARYEDDAACSGGAKVTFLGGHEANRLEWRDVHSRKGGLYEVTLLCAGDKPGEATCRVNGGAAQRLSLPAAGNGRPAAVRFNIRLKRGRNTVSLGNAAERCPDIDCMKLRRIGK